MILTSPAKRGFAVCPFIFLPSRLIKNTPDYFAELAHEKTHCDRQGWFVVWWILKWYFSKRFRWQEESLAFKNQMLSLKKSGRTVNRKYFVATMSKEYRGMCTKRQARRFVNEVLSGD